MDMNGELAIILRISEPMNVQVEPAYTCDHRHNKGYNDFGPVRLGFDVQKTQDS